MHRDSFCVTKSRRFYRTKPVLISTTANVALGLKTNNNRLPIITNDAAPRQLGISGRRAGAQECTHDKFEEKPACFQMSCAGRRSRLSHSLFGWLYKTKPSSWDTVSSYFLVYTNTTA